MPNCSPFILLVVGMVAVGSPALPPAHDVPDRSFDRAVQVTIEPERIHVAYHLSLTQFTLAEELLALAGLGGVSGASAHDRRHMYAEKMGPLLAEGLLVQLDGSEAKLQFARATHRVEGHPRFHFEFELPLEPMTAPRSVHVEDTSFFGEKGWMRLAVRAAQPCVLIRSTAALDVEAIRLRSSWETSAEEQDAARRAEVEWRVDSALDSAAPAEPAGSSRSPENGSVRRGDELLSLLDRWSDGFYIVLLGVAFFFGAAHAMTPGHGKTMVAAYLVGERGTLRHAIGLGLTTSLTHTSSVLLVALLLWLIGPAIEQQIQSGFALVSGLLVAGLGACLFVARLRGRFRSGVAPPLAACDHTACQVSVAERPGAAEDQQALPSWAGLITLGVSGGIVPCWDAVVLLLMAMAQGQVDRAVVLLLSFSAGLASVLVLVGVLAVKMRGFLSGRMGAGRIVQSLPVVSAAAILAIGLYLCVNTLQAQPSAAALDARTANRMVAP